MQLSRYRRRTVLAGCDLLGVLLAALVLLACTAVARGEDNPHGKTEAGAAWVAGHVDAGTPVLAGGVRHVKWDRAGQVVHYTAPGGGPVMTMPYGQFWHSWDGRAATEAYHPGLKPPSPKIGMIPIEHPAPPPRAVAFPSNQDIRDGVRRPDDTLRYGAFGQVGGLSPGYDYYSEFRGRRQDRP